MSGLEGMCGSFLFIGLIVVVALIWSNNRMSKMQQQARARDVSRASPTMTCRVRSAASPATMSGFSTKSSRQIRKPPATPERLIFRAAARAGRKSATAAAMMSPSTAGNSRSRAACISRAVSTAIVRTPRGGATPVGPVTKTTR